MDGYRWAVGVTSDVDPAGMLARVRFPGRDNVRSYWLPVMAAWAAANNHYRLPDVGEQVVCLLDASADAGVILGAVHGGPDQPAESDRDVAAVRFSDGTVVRYDRKKKEMLVDAAGTVTVRAAGLVTVKAPEVFLDTPLVRTSGDVQIGGSLGVAGSGSGASVSISGDVSVDGAVIDSGGNTNHHSHQ